MLRGTRYSATGFTLIELMIVIAIIAVITATAIPSLIEARKSANESAAIGALRTVVSAQALFRESDKDGDGFDYAGDLGELLEFDPGVADLFDSDPRDPDPNDPNTPADPNDPNAPLCCARGYYFAVQGTEAPPAAAHRMLAVPLSRATGNRVFSADETGRILAAVGRLPGPGDEIIDPGTGPSACGAGCDGPPPIPIPAAADLALLGEVLLATARAVVLTLDQIASGDGVPGALAQLDDPTLPERALGQLDRAADGVGFDDLVQSDLVAMARALKPPIAPPEPIVVDDAVARAILSSYQQELEEIFDLGLDAPQPTLPTAGLPGDPRAFLEGLVAAVPLIGGAAWVLLALGLTLAGALRIRRRARSR